MGWPGRTRVPRRRRNASLWARRHGSWPSPAGHGACCQDWGMQLRIFTEPQEGADYGTLLSVARATEELGFDAFFRSDHYLAMGGPGLPGPTDAWVTLAALARETSRIRLGTLMSPV